jgi:hypothetical protein
LPCPRAAASSTARSSASNRIVSVSAIHASVLRPRNTSAQVRPHGIGSPGHLPRAAWLRVCAGLTTCGRAICTASRQATMGR